MKPTPARSAHGMRPQGGRNRTAVSDPRLLGLRTAVAAPVTGNRTVRESS